MGVSGSRRCTLKADIKEWQTVTCYVDRQASTPVEQVAIAIPSTVMRGDMWISRVTEGERKRRGRDRIWRADRVVPRLQVPGITPGMVGDTPLYGFTYPVLTPDAHGETYGSPGGKRALVSPWAPPNG